ncbi:TIGR03619 family F420-dependent LLM class oxidoreductase [Mycobacterium sp. 3519A]|uniref:TIGR03619 family F420-dependent LLM class oxidoreductase n=1 Tax=Mycobacterium sp. 3519A TaxID=2057184 RepID=UPI000C7E5183|nr:TIGR03619 family F420-dependent LLM class oxidoreductase [Mycobacterium sp. 3519A]
MRLGLSTPIVVQVPGVAGDWEDSATIDDLALIAETADCLGFDYLTCSEHVAIPRAVAPTRGAVYWDPLATLGFLAARTSKIRLASSVVVLGYHHPLEIAKRYGTLDTVSRGRLILGVGIGSLAEEFELLDAAWERRAARADDAIAALRTALSTNCPEYRGEFYEFADMIVDPCAVQPRVPIWVGGRTVASLRRAERLADGWMPFGLTPDAVRVMLDDVDIPTGFVVALSTVLDPQADPAVVRDRLKELRRAGATATTVAIKARSAVHYCQQLERLWDVATGGTGY